jgi:hypothetical protein
MQPLAQGAYPSGDVSLEGWIFMVGLRVFDVGALIIWLVWFFRLRDDDTDDDGDDFRRGDDDPEPEPEPRGGPGLDLPLPDSAPWPARRRDHGGDRDPARPSPRRAPRPAPVPAGKPERRTSP